MSSQQIEQEYQKYRTSMPSLEADRSRISGELGIPTQQKSIQNIQRTILNTQGLLDRIPGNVQNRARAAGGPVTSSVLDRITGVEQKPIIGQLNNLGMQEQSSRVGLSDAQQELMARLGLLNQSRQETTQDYIRRITMAAQQEESAKNRAASGAGSGYGDPFLQQLLSGLTKQQQDQQNQQDQGVKNSVVNSTMKALASGVGSSFGKNVASKNTVSYKSLLGLLKK